MTAFRNVAVAAPSPAAPLDNCAPLEKPKKLPAASVLLDSVALMGKLATLETASLGNVTVSVMPDAVPHAHLVDVLVPSATTDSVRAMVLSAVRAAGKNFPDSYRVHVVGGQNLTIAIERSVMCAPTSDGGRLPRGATPGKVTVRTGVVRTTGGVASSTSRPREINVRMLVDSTGAVVDATLGGGSGNTEVDRSIRESAMQQTFQPATLDGRPVRVWLARGKVELAR